jgi:DNA-binding transcriptional LysR family regulator
VSKVDLKRLRYFVAIAEAGSFTGASSKLFTAQPPLSYQIKQLESELGCKVFNRNTRGISLTNAGNTLLRHAREILAQVEETKATLQRINAGLDGTISIGFVPSASKSVIPKFLDIFRQSWPQVEIRLNESISNDQIEQLAKQQIDLAIVRPPLMSQNFQVLATINDPFCVAFPKKWDLPPAGGQINLATFASRPMVAFKRYSTRAFFDQTISLCINAGFSPKISSEVTTVHGALDLVSVAHGFAIIPTSCCSLSDPRITFVPFDNGPVTGELQLLSNLAQQSIVTENAKIVLQKIFNDASQSIWTIS